MPFQEALSLGKRGGAVGHGTTAVLETLYPPVNCSEVPPYEPSLLI